MDYDLQKIATLMPRAYPTLKAISTVASHNSGPFNSGFSCNSEEIEQTNCLF